MMQNRHKRIKHMNSFINVRRQRKLRKFSENPFSGSQVLGFGSRVPPLGSLVLSLGPTYELGTKSLE